jgi:hypothetical protein
LIISDTTHHHHTIKTGTGSTIPQDRCIMNINSVHTLRKIIGQ